MNTFYIREIGTNYNTIEITAKNAKSAAIKYFKNVLKQEEEAVLEIFNVDTYEQNTVTLRLNVTFSVESHE